MKSIKHLYENYKHPTSKVLINAYDSHTQKDILFKERPNNIYVDSYKSDFFLFSTRFSILIQISFATTGKTKDTHAKYFIYNIRNSHQIRRIVLAYFRNTTYFFS